MSTPDTITRELAALDDALAGRPVDPDLAALADLALLLREDRPVPDPAFARRLDVRAERHFPRERAPAGRFGVKWPRIPRPALALAASFVLVAGVTVGVLSQQNDVIEPLSGESQSPLGGTSTDSSSDSAGAPRSKPAAPTPGSSGSASTPAVIGPLP
ncbi:MAG: hypothetical protein M3O90_06960, partial [Actinomycetota bacterium]|nr:hypothetical protein [Actinomycetota bacterium]